MADGAGGSTLHVEIASPPVSVSYTLPEAHRYPLDDWGRACRGEDVNLGGHLDVWNGRFTFVSAHPMGPGASTDLTGRRPQCEISVPFAAFGPCLRQALEDAWRAGLAFGPHAD